ncbi:MAG TPA: hypothetical protein VKH35_16055 [Thermoanaerobaculia bacterium]|nr:hypothetical protein [Thermoanaerobaculia bacterium]
MPVLALLLAVTIDGTICRMNRGVDRIILDGDSGSRLRVAVGKVPLSFKGHAYDRVDLRPGDRVRLVARRTEDHLVARSLEVTMRVDDQLVDSFFRSHRPITGRFARREGKKEIFSIHLPQRRFVRVDAKGATGPDGHVPVRVVSFRPGDLLELHGRWETTDLFRAASINVLTDYEPSFCRNQARRGEYSTETQMRESDERSFLDKAGD